MDYDVVIVSYCFGDDSVRIAEAIRPHQMLVLDAYVPPGDARLAALADAGLNVRVAGGYAVPLDLPRG